MLGLPKTTPTAGIMVTTGALCVSIRAQTKQILYLKKVLKKQDQHWTKITLLALTQHNTGWAKQIDDNLEEWSLDTDWDSSKRKPTTQWKPEVLDSGT